MDRRRLLTAMLLGSLSASAVALRSRGAESAPHEWKAVLVVDALRAWRPPFNPSGVIAEAAELLDSYGVYSVSGDRYAGEFPRERFRAHGITYEVAEQNRRELYLDLLPVMNSTRLELPEDKDLLRELRALERRRGQAGLVVGLVRAWIASGCSENSPVTPAAGRAGG